MLDVWRDAGSVPSVTDNAEAVTAAIADAVVLVAVDDDEVVGTLIAGWDGWRGNFYRLAVRPGRQRQGIAADLVRAGEAALRRKSCIRIGAIVVDEHEHAISFWKALGYTRDDRVGRFTKTLD